MTDCPIADKVDEYEEVEWNHTCEYRGRGFDTKGGLRIHIGMVHTAR